MVYLNGKNNQFYKCDHIHTEIESPEPKTYSVDIPLTDGALDLTGQMSRSVFYEDRQITIGLELRTLRGEWPRCVSLIMNEIHGQEVRVEFDDDPRYYWTGRATVQVPEDHGATLGITIIVQAKPLKRKNARSLLYDDNVGGSDSVTFDTTATRTYFYFDVHTLNPDTTVTYDGETWSLPAGQSTAFGLFVTPGQHTFTFHGNDDLTVEMEEAIL